MVKILNKCASSVLSLPVGLKEGNSHDSPKQLHNLCADGGTTSQHPLQPASEPLSNLVQDGTIRFNQLSDSFLSTTGLENTLHYFVVNSRNTDELSWSDECDVFFEFKNISRSWPE